METASTYGNKITRAWRLLKGEGWSEFQGTKRVNTPFTEGTRVGLSHSKKNGHRSEGGRCPNVSSPASAGLAGADWRYNEG